MIARSKSREIIFKLVFMASFYDTEDAIEKIKAFDAFSMIPDEDISTSEEMGDEEESPLALTEDDIEALTESDRDYIISKAIAVIEYQDKIDASIEEKSTEWKISRIGRIELSLIRLAAYEALVDAEIPAKVAIDEAVELAKRYGQSQSYSFVNGVLARLV